MSDWRPVDISHVGTVYGVPDDPVTRGQAPGEHAPHVHSRERRVDGVVVEKADSPARQVPEGRGLRGGHVVGPQAVEDYEED